MDDIDSIVEQTENSTNNEIPMEAPPQEVQEAPQVPQEYEFESEGRKYKGNVEKLIRWAQHGVNAPNKIGQMAKQLGEYESKIKQYEPYDKVYRPIDDWAKKNPEKWTSLLNGWQQAQFGGTNQGQTNQLPPEVLQKLQDHDQKWQQLEQKETVQREKHADQSLDGAIQSIRKQFSNIDFDAPDENGNSLELQILKHATDTGIPNFRAAFRDYCFDKMNSFSEMKGRELGGKIPAKTKDALLGKNSTAKSNPVIDVRNRNYDQIHELVLADLGLRS